MDSDTGYFSELKAVLASYLDSEQLALCHRAYIVAESAHQGQMRRSGEPYITHPVAAAVILAEMRLDSQTIMATLLHDVIEDTPLTKDDLIEQFGVDVAELVDGVSKLNQIKFESRAEAQAENFRKMVLAMVRDIRVIIVKLADRLHNMRTLGVMPPEKKRRIAIETLEIYAPIANRLGMRKMYIGLEDLGFKALYPMRFRALSAGLEKAKGHRQKIMQKIQDDIFKASTKFDVPMNLVVGRQKHLYSIYKKMRSKRASFSEIMDVFGFRVIVDDIDTCYRVLGALHRTYKPVPERFKDYIGIPKANGYQSLHTTLFGPGAVPIEIQIRSLDMDQVAENGIAAHWIYKKSAAELSSAQLKAREWVQSLLDMEHSSSLEFIENVKIDLFPDEIYVFTPKGHIMELPRGATPVDFAYMVHSAIGNNCVAAKIDKRLAPLSLNLANGQTVEIITASGASPNPAWLNFVVTGKARSTIRHFIKSQQHAESIALGQRLLSNALQELSAAYEDVPEETMHALLRDLQYESKDGLHKDIGIGEQVAMVVAKRLVHEKDPQALPVMSKEALAIKGTEGMVVSYGDCCHPIPGDPILGVLASGHGIVVHREYCAELKRRSVHLSKSLSLKWADDVKGEFWVDVTVEVSNQRGVLASLASAISQADANIGNIKVDQKDGFYNDVTFSIAVSDRVHLAKVMRRVRNNRVVLHIVRH